ncbi:MAG: MBL fold metallo-hydrolase [Clostridia bacterium]|nr:MBL fold metallo-hydrolase [Clostridia bacterium]
MIKCFDNGMISSNVYVVWDKGQGMIIDCGAPCDDILSFVNENQIKIRYIVLTHGHHDHVCQLANYVKAFPSASVICHSEEIKVLTDSEANVSLLFGSPCVYNYDYTTVKEGDALAIGDLNFQVLLTPGHTPGSICLLEEEKKVLFTGDVLFENGYGRTDFKYGSSEELMCSLRRLFKLDKDIIFYSGHGPSARLGY